MNSLLILAIMSAAAALAGFVWAMIERGRASAAATELRLVRAQADESRRVIEAQSARAAGAVAEEMVRRATETFQAQDRVARERLEAQLKPVAETLARFQEQVNAAEMARAEASGGLRTQIEQLMAATSATQDEARKLSTALRRGAGVQGRWGEQMLRNVLEMAGLRRPFDFEEQVTTEDPTSLRRPDVVVKMPGGGLFVIDAKCSLNAYLEAQEAPDETSREAGYLRHAQSVRGHIQSLSAKAYWDQFEASPDFVAMFVPGDGFLAAALERNPELMTEAMEKRVILVTPTTLFGLCKVVAYGWRVEKQAKNADEIAKHGRELYRRLSNMGGHAASVGKALEAAVQRYNNFVGSLETQVMSEARRFEELHADHEGKEMPPLPQVETSVRLLTKLADSMSEKPTLTVGNRLPTSAA